MLNETIVDLETCAACCLSCNFCPRDRVKRNSKLLKEESVRNLATVINNKNIVWLSGLGEPLLFSPDRTIALLKQTSAKVYSNTNASFTGFPLVLYACVNSGLSFLNISIYGWNEKSYLETTKHNSFDLVKRNVTIASKLLPIRLSFVKTKDSPENIKELLMNTFNISHIRILEKHGRGDANQSVPPSQCALCNNYLFVSSDGVAFPCANDVEEAHSLGTDFKLVSKLKKEQYPWAICNKCDCGARFASFKEGYLEKVFNLDKQKLG